MSISIETILGAQEDVLEFLLGGYDDAENGARLVEQDGGGEGGSEYCYSIVELNGKYYRCEYSYYSHMGYDNYDSFEEVWPVEVTVTQYTNTKPA
ncbi:hypothetical protein NVP1081O_062 [Vibrio phage 1.081.O._10N.286.52.C2]|nr:hypothetical protein NVP1081O_062 [Vibrio phage 1.081.O._10N.286.52.C2]